MPLRPSAVVLVLVNLVPIVGVLAFDWRVFDILLLYWVENVIIGAINVLRMLAASRGLGQDRVPHEHRATVARLGGAAKLFMIPFFIVHYGMFCFGHIAGILALFGDEAGTSSIEDLLFGMDLSAALTSPIWIAIAAIAISHLFSFAGNYLADGEYRRTDLAQLMRRPYGRIIILHITIIAGAALIQLIGAPVAMLVVLVAVKIAVDLKLHLSERRIFSADAVNA